MWRLGLHIGILALGLTLVGSNLGQPRGYAQESPFRERLLVGGVDINGQGYPIALIDLATRESTTLATFGNRPVCLPTLYANGTALIYESINQFTVYQLNIASRERQVLRQFSEEHCPILAPAGNRVAWVRPTSELGANAELILTDAQGNNARSLTSHEQIFDVIWSPTGSLLIYSSTSSISPYPELYSLSPDNLVEPYRFWTPAMGFILDYEWAGSGSGLLVAYRDDSGVMLGLMSVECMVGVQSACLPEVIATFPPDAELDLLNAFAPTRDDVLVSLQFPDATIGIPKADLWIVDLTGQVAPLQITFSPNIIKTDALWSGDGRYVYFVGSRYDIQTEVLRGAIYSVSLTESNSETLLFESDIFSPANILWRYD